MTRHTRSFHCNSRAEVRAKAAQGTRSRLTHTSFIDCHMWANSARVVSSCTGLSTGVADEPAEDTAVEAGCAGTVDVW